MAQAAPALVRKEPMTNQESTPSRCPSVSGQGQNLRCALDEGHEGDHAAIGPHVRGVDGYESRYPVTTTPDIPLVDLDELEALAKAATPGPWCQHPNGTSVWQGPDWEAVNYAKARVQNSRHVCNATAVDQDAVDDTAFIAAANPSAVLALIAETRALRAKAQGDGWIACSERMPEFGPAVLIRKELWGDPELARLNGEGSGESAVTYCWLIDNSGEERPLSEVTMWHALPAPPEAT